MAANDAETNREPLAPEGAHAANEPDAQEEEAETEGYLLGASPYAVEKMGERRRQDLLAEAERARRAAQATPDRPPTEGILGKVRRRGSDQG